MPNMLENLKLSELSLVKDPANIHCHVTVTKAAFNPLLPVRPVSDELAKDASRSSTSARTEREMAPSMCARSARACARSRSYFSTVPAISSRLLRSLVTVRISAMDQLQKPKSVRTSPTTIKIGITAATMRMIDRQFMRP